MKLNRIMTLAAMASVLASCCISNPKVEPAIPQDQEVEAKVEKALKGMTL